MRSASRVFSNIYNVTVDKHGTVTILKLPNRFLL